MERHSRSSGESGFGLVDRGVTAVICEVQVECLVIPEIGDSRQQGEVQ